MIMAKIKKELLLTLEETDALTKANLVLEKIIKVLDTEEDYLGEGITYPDILDEIYRNIESCFYIKQAKMPIFFIQNT